MARGTVLLRRWHRRLSLAIGLQLLVWTGSGLVFTCHPIEEVRGEHLLAPEEARSVTPASALPLDRAAAAAGLDELRSATLGWRRDRLVWELRTDDGAVLVDAAEGHVLPELDAAGAAALARKRLAEPRPVLHVQRIEEARGEYRGGAVPAWRVDLAGGETPSLYLDARTGEVQAVRTEVWRRYDFLWMLHIMDYRERQEFSHPLLTAAASLGVLTSLTGLAVAWTIYRPRRRRASA